jgi:hypothetical protein
MTRLGTPTTNPTPARPATRKPLSGIAPSSRAEADPEPLDGTVVLESTPTGYSARATYLVRNLVGDGLGLYASALFAKGLPSPGDEFAWITGLKASGARVVSIDGFSSTAKVEISWGFPAVNIGPWENPADDNAVPQLETFTSLVTVATNLHQAGDFAGDPIRVNWPTRLRNQDPNDGLTTAPETGASVQYMRPVSGLRFTRRELSRPDARAQEYVGKVNSRKLFEDGDEKLWMCTRLDGTTDDNGESYNVTYEFQKAANSADGWRGFAYYTDPATGQLPEFLGAPGQGPEAGAGITTVELYDSIDFHQLNLRIGE